MTKPTTPKPDPHAAATYQICLQGHLDARWADQLEVAGLTHEGDGTTLIRVVAADQSALHGMLQRIRDLGLPLISVTRSPPSLTSDERTLK
ncbi:MAG: hypothetical protein ABI697_09725 [Devosia sp.]